MYYVYTIYTSSLPRGGRGAREAGDGAEARGGHEADRAGERRLVEAEDGQGAFVSHI